MSKPRRRQPGLGSLIFLIMILSLPCGIRNGEPLALMVFIPSQTRVSTTSIPSLLNLSGYRMTNHPLFIAQMSTQCRFFLQEKLVATARQAEGQGLIEKARALYLRAAAVYRIARFPVNRSPMGQKAWELGENAYSKGGRFLNPPSVEVDIPFTHVTSYTGAWRYSRHALSTRKHASLRPPRHQTERIFAC
jgi:hypothetical protein